MPVDVTGTIASLIAGGITPDQIAAATQTAVAVKAESDAAAALTQTLPSVTTDQITAFRDFVIAGHGLPSIEPAAATLWQLIIAGDTTNFPKAITFLAATVFRLRPDLAPVPALTLIQPATGAQGATALAVAITGKNLTGATLNVPTGITASNVVVTANQITADLAIAADATVGSVDITATVGMYTTPAVTFAVTAPPVTDPQP